MGEGEGEGRGEGGCDPPPPAGTALAVARTTAPVATGTRLLALPEVAECDRSGKEG